MKYSTTSDLLHNDLRARRARVSALMNQQGIEAALFTMPANLFYLTGRIADGYLLLHADGDAHLFARRPVGLEGEGITYIKHPSQIPGMMGRVPQTLALEDHLLPHAEYAQLCAIFGGAKVVDGAVLAEQARAVKTPLELAALAEAGRRQAQTFSKIPEIYWPGMTDREFQIEFERELRRNGHMGLFRTNGFRLEGFMGLVLAGENGYAPAPYDFALGGAGEHPGFPGGACGKKLLRGELLLVDFCFVYDGYQTDMTRVFSIGEVPEKAHAAQAAAVTIQEELAAMARPGTRCADLCRTAFERAEAMGFADTFMGIAQQAKFVGHGIGIEVNELPVLTARSDTVLEENMVLAIEPKIMVPGCGAAGIENTYHVTKDGGVSFTAPCVQELIALEAL